MCKRHCLSLATLVVLSTLVLSTACDGLDWPWEDDSTDTGVPSLLSAQSVGWHYVEVVFDLGVPAEYANKNLYAITGPDGETLEIQSASIRDDSTRVLLTTASQRAVQYDLTFSGTTAAVDESGYPIPVIAAFKGSTDVEPSVASAIALSSTSVLVTFSTGMDDNITTKAFYEIAFPDLDVVSVTAGAGNTTALLETSEQENIDYTVRVTNVTSSNGAELLDPTQSTATFNGIAPSEPPVMTGAAATSSTSILVSFNKPMADDAADPTKYSISPGLVIATAQMTTFNTQVLLTTLPMAAGRKYTVTATDIADQGGVAIGDSPANQATFTFDGQSQTDGSQTLPRVVGASSLSNTSIMVVFNKPMADSALVSSNYVIVQENINTEVGTLVVLNNACNAASANAGDACSSDTDCTGGLCVIRSPHWGDASRTTVVLTTSSQNEVTYRVRATSVRDISGNELAPQEALVDPTSATFPGTPPSGNELVDSDLDGLYDNVELRGYVVTTVASDGEITRTEVTSNPYKADSDLDGLNDAEEKQINTNPRLADSDGDRISDSDEFNVWYSSPLHQDTDADDLDDQLEIFFFKTSALLDDTDGDGLKDGDEVVAGNRNPRVSDLPQPAITVGEVALRLDTRFAYTNTEGVQSTAEQTNETTLTQSDEKKFTTSDTETMKHFVEAGFEGGLDQGKGTAKVKINYNFTYETTFTSSQESTAKTEAEYQNTLKTSVQRDVTQEVVRTIDGASIDLTVSLSNYGDIPFTMNNLEITALMQDPYNREKFTPVATLLPSSQLTSGNFEVFLGPFIKERGPFIFKNTEIFPSLVEDLMKHPRGLIFQVANYDVEDEQGRNFAYISQDVNDRTAGLIIDYGNGEVDRYRIATNNAFDTNGRPTGITMAYALRDILGLTKNSSNDAITIGSNGCAETFATGDDVQVTTPICYPVTPGDVIIEPGPNGLLESTPVGDDKKSSDGLRIIDGGDGCAHTRASRDDVQVVEGDCAAGGTDGVVILAGENGIIDSTPAGDDELTAVNGYGTERIGTCDGLTTNKQQVIEPPFDGNGIANTRAKNGTDDVQVVAVGSAVTPGQVIVGPGANGILETKPIGDEIRLGPGALCDDDSDCPGSGTCRKIERLVRVKGVQNIPEEARLWAVLVPQTVSVGTDFDNLPLKAGQTYSLAFVQDQDMDGLYDREEYVYGSSDTDDNSDGCPLGDGAVGCDTTVYDFDTVQDYDEVKTGWKVQVAGQSSYIAYCNPVQPDTDSDGLFDDEELALGTDPGKQDTDGDDIEDRDEVKGYTVVREDGQLIRNVLPYQSAFITAGQNSTLDSVRVGDDVQGLDTLGQPIITAGANGILDSVTDKDDVIDAAEVIIDGGNGIPESVASVGDVQVGPSPVATRNVTVTYVDFTPGADTCDTNDAGEFHFNLRLRHGVDTIVGTYDGKATIEAFGTHSFGGVIIDKGNGTAETTAQGDDVQVVANGDAVTPGGIIITPGTNGKLDTTTLGGDDEIVTPKATYTVAMGEDDTIAIGASVIEDDPTCDANTRSVIAEPASGGNHLVDTAAVGDDQQLVTFGGAADAGETVVRSCPLNTNGVLDSTPASPGLCEEVIVAGADGVADTVVGAGTDDVQTTAATTSGLASGTVVIAPGPNGQIDTSPSAGDEFVGPSLPLACEGLIIEPASGGNGTANTTATGDDIQVVASGAAAAAGAVIIRPGPNGVIDSTPGGDDVTYASTLATSGNCGACYSGACVATHYDCSACPSAACYGDDTLVAKAVGDSCEDGWLLADTSELCPCGSCREYNSSTPSTFSSWSPQSLTLTMTDIASITSGGAIYTFSSGPGCFAGAQLRVLVQVTDGVAVTPGAVIVRAGSDGVLDTVPMGDDVVGVAHKVLYASNPLNRDTDGDTLFDGAEQTLGANPNDPLDAQDYRDNDLDGLPNGVEIAGWFVGYTDAAGNLQCVTDTGYLTVTDPYNPPAACQVVTSDPFEPDTDFDGLPDLLEKLLRSDPRSADTDGDGLPDYDEFDPDSRFSIPVLTLREFQRLCSDAGNCSFTPAKSPTGTSVVLADTDQDGRTDRAEVQDYWVIAPCTLDASGNQYPGVPRAVYSSPLDPDYDLDGVPDGQEMALLLDPANSDTDGDHIVDSEDTAPDGCGKRVTVTFSSYAVGGDNCEPSSRGDGEFRFTLHITQPDGNVVTFSQNDDTLADNENHVFPTTFTTTFSLRPGQHFHVSGFVSEDDSPDGDETWSFDRQFEDTIITGQQTINPLASEGHDGCMDDDQLVVDVKVGQL
jgi:hypothetical protein